jgi:N-acetylglucosamine kinase-like BadF-type ATPase
MRYVLGMDGGQSKTVAVVADETGLVLGVGRSGNCNYQGQGIETAMTEVQTAAEGALAMAGLSRVSVAFYSVAGADLPEDFAVLRPAIGGLDLADRTIVDNDIVAALRSGTESPDAVAVGWGSGTNALGRNAAGQEVRLPALGQISGDWGGGADLGREAIWLVARAADGRGEPTALTELVLPALGVATAEEMIRRLYLTKVPAKEILDLAPLVFRAARDGDAVARKLVERSGEEVVVTALALLRRLDLLGNVADVVLAGSIFRGEGTLLLDTVRGRLAAEAPLARIVIPELDPVLGSLLCALDALGVPTSEDVRRRAQESYETLRHHRLS